MSKISEKVGKIIVHKRIFCQTNRRKKKNNFFYVMDFVVELQRQTQVTQKKMKINQETKHIQNDDHDRTEQNKTKKLRH